MDALNEITLDEQYRVKEAREVPSLPPPIRLEPGSIVTLRMRGHSRTNGQEYFAPAVVLEQHQPNGEIGVLVWDATAGTHYNPSYPVREISSRGDGNVRELYVVQENVGKVLFSPDKFEQVLISINVFGSLLDQLSERVKALEVIRKAELDARVPVATPLPSTDEPKVHPKKA